jgi:hypothetical protein
MSLQCFYKLGVIAYYNLNREYIAEVLCINKEKPMEACHGQCFLKRNLDLTKKSTPKDTRVPATRQVVEFPQFLITELSYSFDVTSALIKGSFHYSLGSSMDHSSSLFRPPAFFS